MDNYCVIHNKIRYSPKMERENIGGEIYHKHGETAWHRQNLKHMECPMSGITIKTDCENCEFREGKYCDK